MKVQIEGLLKAAIEGLKVGSYTPEMQEVPPGTLQRAKVFVDSRSASFEEAGELIQPLRAGLFDESHICGELGEVVLGRVAGRQSAEEITYFKSVGVAVQDAMAAQVTLENGGRLSRYRLVDDPTWRSPQAGITLPPCSAAVVVE